MKVLMLSRDAKIFEPGSLVRARMVEYGTLFEELHIVAPTDGKQLTTNNPQRITENVFVYSVYARIKFLYFWKMYAVCKKILNRKSACPAVRRRPGEILNLKWVVTSQDPFETGFVACLVSKKFNVPLQIQIHTDFLSPYFRNESLKNFIRYVASKIVMLKADCVRAVSERIKNSISTRYTLHATRYTTLPIFVDVEKIKNAQQAVLPRKFAFTILWVGRLEREKNCSLALQAFSKVLKKIPKAGLVIVGDGTERKKLELQAASNKLQANVIFEGWKNDVAGYYKSADVLLVTSWYEGYGMNMVEARIASIPVIAPDVGVASEVGAYITSHTADSIVHTLTQLYGRKLPKVPEYEYPYENKEQYLKLYKESFLTCLSKNKKIL